MKESVKENIKPLIFIVIVLFLTAISAYPQLKFGGRVIEVVDGKTCVVELPSGRLTVVLQYIEVPDPEQPLHETVKEHLRNLVLDKRVELMPNGVVKDRTFGRLYVKGVDISQQMLRDGAAWYSAVERSGQDEDDKAVYQNNENQAKAEKRGVWGVEGLKPVWEYRAEKEAQQKRLEKDALTRRSLVAEVQSRNKTLTQPLKTVANDDLWGNIGAGAQYNLPYGVDDLRVGSDPVRKVGFIYTPGIFLNFPGEVFLRKAEARVLYGYGTAEANADRSVFLIGFVTASKDYKFAQKNGLTITADNQKIVATAMRRFFRQSVSSVEELIFYRVTRAQLIKITKARKVSIRLGDYSSAVSGESLASVKSLLSATE